MTIFRVIFKHGYILLSTYEILKVASKYKGHVTLQNYKKLY